MKNNLFVIGLIAVMLSGCATYPISSSLRASARKNLTFETVLNNSQAYVGSIVIWGGIIVDTTNLPDGTEITILETPMRSGEIPLAAGYSAGRFIAKSSHFFDPEIFSKGRRITVAGEISGSETRQLGKTNYIYPVIKVKQLHIWRAAKYVYCPYSWDQWGNWPFSGECYEETYWE